MNVSFKRVIHQKNHSFFRRYKEVFLEVGLIRGDFNHAGVLWEM